MSKRGLIADYGSAKRTRTRASARSIARAIAYRNRAKFPYSQYGVAHMKRGAPITTATFGPSYKSANASQREARRMTGYSGRGLYGGRGNFWKSFGRGFSRFGRTLGRGISSGAKWAWKNRKDILSTAEKAAEIAALAGVGLYEGPGLYEGSGLYGSNQLVAGGRPAGKMVGMNDETDSIIINRMEYIQDIFAPEASTDGSNTTGFHKIQIPINAALANAIPALSQEAINYSEYEFIQLVFELKPTINETNINNGISGTVLATFDYDNNTVYSSKHDIVASHGGVSNKITDLTIVGVECDASKNIENSFRTRSTPLKTGEDPNDYDKGILIIATDNVPNILANQQLFELWCYYTVVLRKPKSGALKLNNQLCDNFLAFNSAQDISIDTVSQLFNADNGAMISGLGIGQMNNIGGAISTNFQDLTGETLASGDQSAVLKYLISSQKDSKWANLTTTSHCQLSYIFPPFNSGYYRVKFNLKFGVEFTLAATKSISVDLFSCGHVSLLSDMVAPTTYDDSTGSGSNQKQTQDYSFQPLSLTTDAVANTVSSAGVSTVRTVCVEFHVAVTSVSGGINNGFTMNFTVNGTTMSGNTMMLGQLEVIEYSANQFSKPNVAMPLYITQQEQPVSSKMWPAKYNLSCFV